MHLFPFEKFKPMFNEVRVFALAHVVMWPSVMCENVGKGNSLRAPGHIKPIVRIGSGQGIAEKPDQFHLRQKFLHTSWDRCVGVVEGVVSPYFCVWGGVFEALSVGVCALWVFLIIMEEVDLVGGHIKVGVLTQISRQRRSAAFCGRDQNEMR